jgi:hypothetical protein
MAYFNGNEEIVVKRKWNLCSHALPVTLTEHKLLKSCKEGESTEERLERERNERNTLLMFGGLHLVITENVSPEDYDEIRQGYFYYKEQTMHFFNTNYHYWQNGCRLCSSKYCVSCCHVCKDLQCPMCYLL